MGRCSVVFRAVLPPGCGWWIGGRLCWLPNLGGLGASV